MKQERHRHVCLRPGSLWCLSVILTPPPHTFMYLDLHWEQLKIRDWKQCQAWLSACSPAIARAGVMEGEVDRSSHLIFSYQPSLLRVNKLNHNVGLYSNLFIAYALIGQLTSRGNGDIDNWSRRKILNVTSLARWPLSLTWSLLSTSTPMCASRAAAGSPWIYRWRLNTTSCSLFAGWEVQ